MSLYIVFSRSANYQNWKKLTEILSAQKCTGLPTKLYAANKQQSKYNSNLPNASEFLRLNSLAPGFGYKILSKSAQNIVFKKEYLGSRFSSNNKEPTSERLFQDSEKKQCKPVKNVIFLKTHKTGSSTIINIMQRFAHRNNLTVVLPENDYSLGWPNVFNESYVFEHTKNKTYNIICNHAVFHRERMLKIMESNETKIVTIIRDPLYQFESAAVYYGFHRILKLNRKISILDAFFDKSKDEIYHQIWNHENENKFMVKNPVAFDMGFRTWCDTESAIINNMEQAKKDFDLVMISDYMAESLILLKDLLCWDLKDVVYFTLNKRPDECRQKIKNVGNTQKRIREWNKIDNVIFNYFNRTFWEKVNSKGSSFKSDLDKLLSTKRQLHELCLSHGRHYDESQPWFPILGYKLKNENKNENIRTLCKDMIRSEVDFTYLLKHKQTRRNWKIPVKQSKYINKINSVC